MMRYPCLSSRLGALALLLAIPATAILAQAPAPPVVSDSIIRAVPDSGPDAARGNATPARSVAPANIPGGPRMPAPTLSRFDAAPSPPPLPPIPPGGGRMSDGPALMIVGGVGMFVGAVVGGDPGTIITVGGGVTGLIGLYRYLR